MLILPAYPLCQTDYFLPNKKSLINKVHLFLEKCLNTVDINLQCIVINFVTTNGKLECVFKNLPIQCHPKILDKVRLIGDLDEEVSSLKSKIATLIKQSYTLERCNNKLLGIKERTNQEIVSDKDLSKSLIRFEIKAISKEELNIISFVLIRTFLKVEICI